MGTSSSDDRHTIPYELSKHLDPQRTQIFVFAISNLGINDFQIISEKNFKTEDYIIMDWIPTSSGLSAARGISKDDCNDPSSWKQSMTLTRNLLAISYGKVPGLIPFDFLNYVKRVFQQKTFQPHITNDLCEPLSKKALNSVLEDWVLLANEPLPPSLVVKLTKLFQLPNINPKHIFIYLAPINPVLLSDPRFGESSVFAANRKILTTLVRDAGGTLVDYNDGERGFKAIHFHDAVHLVDEGCAELGRTLAKDWKKAFPEKQLLP